MIVSRLIDNYGIFGLPGFSIPAEMDVGVLKSHSLRSFTRFEHQTDVTVARVWS